MTAQSQLVVVFVNGHPNTAFNLKENADDVMNKIETAKKKHEPVRLHMVQEDGSEAIMLYDTGNEYIFAMFVNSISLLAKPQLVVPKVQ